MNEMVRWGVRGNRSTAMGGTHMRMGVECVREAQQTPCTLLYDDRAMYRGPVAHSQWTEMFPCSNRLHLHTILQMAGPELELQG